MPRTRPLDADEPFVHVSNKVRAQCYLHTSQYKPEGWYDKAERVIELGKAFRMT